MSDIEAIRLFNAAKQFDDNKAKAKYLKMAYNSAESTQLLYDIKMYAYGCGINLDEVSGYDY